MVPLVGWWLTATGMFSHAAPGTSRWWAALDGQSGEEDDEKKEEAIPPAPPKTGAAGGTVKQAVDSHLMAEIRWQYLTGDGPKQAGNRMRCREENLTIPRRRIRISGR